MKNIVKTWFFSFVHLFFPRQCAVCGAILQEGEEGICMKCNMDMPRTNYHLRKDNPVERMFWGKIPLEHATSCFFYHKGSDFRRILHQLKYGGRKDLGEVMGRRIGYLKNIIMDKVEDLEPPLAHMIPELTSNLVPLHPRKQKMRGYNQSECIARGVSAVTGIPVDTASVARMRHTETQTRKSSYERWENVDGIFCLRRADAFARKHVLIIDDVLTTGATTTACADALKEVEGVRISVLTLAVAAS